MKRLALATLIAACALTGCSSNAGDGTIPVPPSQTASALPSPPEAVTAAVKPSTVEIPKLDVVEDIVPVGLDADRHMAVPPVNQVGWYDLGPAVGETGPAVLAGHVNYDGVVGAFSRIGELAAGDQIRVTDEAGVVRRFVVYDVLVSPKDEFPTGEVWGDTDGPELRLITCSGQVVDHSYLDNTIVRARVAS